MIVDSQRLLDEKTQENRALSEDLRSAVETNLQLQEKLQDARSELHAQTASHEVCGNLQCYAFVRQQTEMRFRVVECRR